MIDLNDEEQVEAVIEEATRLYALKGGSVHCWLVDLLRSDWKPESWRLVAAREIAAKRFCSNENREHALQGKFDSGVTVQSALAAIRWCEEQGFKKP